MPEQVRFIVVGAPRLQPCNDLAKLAVERLQSHLALVDMPAKRAEGATRLALTPVVDDDLVHDVGEIELKRAHRPVRNHEGALLHPARLEQRRRLGEAARLHHDVGALQAIFPVVRHDNLLAEVLFQVCGKGLPALGTARMDTDLVEIEQMVEQADVPVGRAARADMAQDLAVLARQMLGAERGDRAGAHVRDSRRVDDGLWHAGPRVEQVQQCHFGGQANFVVVDEVTDHLHAGAVERLHIAAQDVEMALVGALGNQVNPGFDHRFATPLRGQRFRHGIEDFVVGQFQCLGVQGIDVVDPDFLHFSSFQISMQTKMATLLLPGGPLGRQNGMRFAQSGTVDHKGDRCRADIECRDSSTLGLGGVPGRHPVAQPSGCLKGSHDMH